MLFHRCVFNTFPGFTSDFPVRGGDYSSVEMFRYLVTGSSVNVAHISTERWTGGAETIAAVVVLRVWFAQGLQMLPAKSEAFGTS